MNMAPPKMKPWIEAISAYVPGRAGGEGRTVKLSSNENPMGSSPAALSAMREAANGSHRYPDAASHGLRDAVAALHGLEPERIVCGTGSDELLQLLALAYAGPGDEVLYVQRGFMVYPIAARRAGAEPVAAPDKDYTADVDNLLAAVTPRTRLVYLANPNNPTGTVIGKAEVERLHAGLPDDVLLVLDAAYAEYMEIGADYEDGIALARRHANVVTTRTFSKIYGLAAARVGWAYGDPEVIGALNRIRGPFNVTSQAQAGAIAALADQDFVRRCREENARERAKFNDAIAALGNHGLRAIPSAANFVLVEFPAEGEKTAEAANAYLTDRGILTRWLPTQDLAHALRVSIGTADENANVIAALQDFMGAP
ncbi:histidinol-phosphate transaminase [Pacificimonas sp. WHA3]|uniref:Histidinol-phosphate aminotransferase n=1 Tax=Pacificimonas pallii TaxID=2827236 RepID=A0ABS6SB61_9SPHN|nr:histidinol-phosphate transaminase [Pacificimonas pallii]MBV7255658.1 histidinol-phosphate transaminase [Pacificimonas pallii]